MKTFFLALVALIAVGITAVAAAVYFGMEQATVPVAEGYGPNPTLPEPNPSLVPTVNIAPATVWPAGATPIAASGMTVNEFAGGFNHPRWLHVLPNGDVLVAESNKPEGAGGRGGIQGWIMGLVMKQAGAGVPSANRITLVRDADGDGVAETRDTFLENLNSPFGMTFANNTLYVANTDAIVAYSYKDGDAKSTGPGVKIADLPGFPLNHHWTKDVIASRDGTRLYATVGSNSNAAENGMAVEENRAAVHEIDIATKTMRLFASGLRNPNGLSWNPQSGELWVAVNERDEIGSDLVPDYMTSVKDGGFYGWPYSYYGQNVDVRVQPQKPDLVATAIVPDYALGAHTGSLGLTFNTGTLFGEAMAGGAFVGQHGSWNRDPPSGYKVIFVPFSNGKPSGQPADILTGFVNGDEEAMGRPVGVAIARDGALLVADDVGNKVWRVAPGNKTAAN